MIYIGEKYAIKADGNGYALHEARVAQSDSVDKKGNLLRKTGEKYWVSMESYHQNVGGCVDKLIKLFQRAEVAENDMTLTEAARRFDEIENRVREWADIGVRSDEAKTANDADCLVAVDTSEE